MQEKKKYCARPFEAIHLDPHGNVRVCSWTDATIGNLLENSIEDIWNGEKAERVRESIKDQSFSFCRSTSCPCLENNELEWHDEETFKAKCVVSEHPKHVNAAFDFRCNHSCPSCRDGIFKADEAYREEADMIAKKAVELLNNADSFSTCGNGDLFASESIMGMLKEVKPVNENCDITLETNGVLFTPENWEKIEHLSKYRLTVIVTPNSYERMTYKYLSGGHDNLDKLVEGLKFMQRLRMENIINNLSISIVVQDRNFKELPSFIERSIDEFEADEVVVKPLYKWFCLSEEDYWFKDVLNPLHPYHKDYLEMMESAIIKHPKVYLWGARNLHPAVKHPAYKYKKLLEVIEQYCNITNAREKLNSVISDYINTKEEKAKLYLYGDNVLSKFFYNQVNEENKKYISIMARDFCDEDAKDSIIDFKKYKPVNGDIIIVTEEYNVGYVQRDLKLLDYSGIIMTINELLLNL